MSSSNSQTPSGELGARCVTKSPPVDFASVEYIVSNKSITEAWKKVRSNKETPGADGISIEKFPKWARLQWNQIKKQLLAGSYKPSPALRVEIHKVSGGVRLLGIPRVLDRVLMQAIAIRLGEIFNPTFSDSSFGYRPYRSVQQAARRAQRHCQESYTIQIDIDLEKYFDTVNNDVLLERLGRRVKNKGLLKLLGKFLRAGVMVNGRLQSTRLGVPQGSPILFNGVKVGDGPICRTASSTRMWWCRRVSGSVSTRRKMPPASPSHPRGSWWCPRGIASNRGGWR